MPSTKPFVISYIALDTMEALRKEAELLTELAAFYRSEGFVQARFGVPWNRVQAGQVAVVQVEHGVDRWPASLLRDMPDVPRPVRQRWLLDPEVRVALVRQADARGTSLSDLVARMVRPLDPKRARTLDLENAGLRFVPPAWAQTVAKERLRQLRKAKKADQRKQGLVDLAGQREEPWPWRAVSSKPDDAKRAYLLWVLTCHPDRGGDHERFVRGKDDFERMPLS
ncbi:MAG: hypothetical protein JWN04_3431 [Myxococcaceae bacterium]|nr:hypothetical protein [Myxococcaceae bacterium]